MRRLATGTLIVACVLLLSGMPCLAQEDQQDMRNDIEEPKKGQQEIRKQLDEIKKLLQSRARPSGPNVEGVTFDLGDNPVKGQDSAKLTLAEFTDYQ